MAIKEPVNTMLYKTCDPPPALAEAFQEASPTVSGYKSGLLSTRSGRK